jgi:hypothetical protein
MAKKRAKGKNATYGKLGDFAEDLGRVLGTAQNKAEGWLGQRKTIAAQLTKVRETADTLLRQLSAGAADIVAVGLAGAKRRGRPSGSKNTKKRGRTFTAAQRKEQAERMRAYWAKRKAKGARKAGGKRGRKSKSAEAGA